MKYYSIFLLFLISCSSAVMLSKADKSQVYQHDKDKVVKTIIEFMNDNSYPIENINEKYGVIQSGYKQVSQFMRELRFKVNFTVDSVDTGTRVSMNLISEQKITAGWKQLDASQSEVKETYRGILNDIEARLK